MDCENITDSFSVSNNAAKLTYKIGMMTLPEASLVNQVNARVSPFYSWYISPNGFFSDVASMRIVNPDGNIGSSGVTNTVGIHPVISLIAGTEYIRGNGSVDNPYIVNMNN